jgi:hypothetical protein
MTDRQTEGAAAERGTSPRPAPGGATDPGSRVVYLIWTHTRPEQIMRVVRAVRTLSPHSTIVVHHDPRGCQVDEDALAAVGGVRLVYSEAPMRWGDVSVLDALLRSLRWVEEHLDYDWIVHLSGQDYPIRPLAELERRLADEGRDGYIIHDRLGTEREVASRLREEAVRRYFFQYYQLPRLRAGRLLPAGVRTAVRRRGQALKKVAAPVYLKPLPREEGVRAGRRARRTPFRDGYACYKGSLWVALSRHAVRRYLATLADRPELYRYYRRTINPDESITATVLANDPTVRLDPDPLRFTDWHAGGAHPDVITVEHLDAMLASDKFFARKFDPGVDAEVLDEIDRRLGLAPVTAAAR